MLLRSIIKTAAWLLDPREPKKMSEEDKQRVLDAIAQAREEQASKIREIELDEIANEIKEVKKSIKTKKPEVKIDYTALVLEALRSEAVMELLANIQDERLHDHVGVTNLIAKKIKEKVEPLEGKVSKIEEGVLAVESKLNADGLVEYIEKTVEANHDPINREYGKLKEVQKYTAKTRVSNRKIREEEIDENQRLKVCKDLELKDSKFSRNSIESVKGAVPAFSDINFDSWFDDRVEDCTFIEFDKSKGYTYYKLGIIIK
jgi:hypothetical protein